jgi:uncharacterized membrane protein YfcA
VLLALLWSEHMDGLPLELPLFLVATFAGALVAGLSGFAFGLVAASIWLYILSPLQSATLIIAFGLIVQGYSVWKLRHALDWRRLRPFLIGAAIGVPVGVSVLTWANPAHLRAGVGVLLVLYSLYAFFRPALKPITGGGAAADAGVGFLNMSALWLGARGAITSDTIRLFAIGLPALAAGTWLGLKLYGRLDEASFRKVVLVLLFASGVVLVV